MHTAENPLRGQSLPSLAAEPAPRSPRLDLERFAATVLQRAPFDFLIVPGFLKREALPAVERDFPAIDSGGSFPATSVTRSEEHTSELQSLMRISYAVFCLKKKKT